MLPMLKTTMELGLSAYLRHPNSTDNSVDNSGHTLKMERVLKDTFGFNSPHKSRSEREKDGGEGKQISVFLSMSTGRPRALWQT